MTIKEAENHLLYEVKERVCYITLNRPDKMNAMSWELRQDLYGLLKRAERDTEVGCIVIRGAGRTFSAGYDLSSERPSPNFPTEGYAGKQYDDMAGLYAHNLIDGWWLIWDLMKPVIAQVHGFCLAGASELASMCDIMFVAEDSQIGYPAVRAISTPDANYFPWKMSMNAAKYYALTGRPVSGKQAVELGWATKSFPAEQLEESVFEEAKALASIQPDLLACSKRSVNRAYEVMGIRTAMNVGADWMAISTHRETEPQFGEIVQEQGLKAALLWRDGNFGDYSAAPKNPR